MIGHGYYGEMKSEQPTPEGRPAIGKSIHILNVDDSPDFRALVKEVLEKESRGFKVTEAASRAEFESRLVENEYDLVLSDFHMQDFLGLHVIEAIQSKAPRVPVVIFSGTGSEASAVECMKRGATDYVVKSPEQMQQLPQTIRSAIEKQRLLDERFQALEALRESEERYRSLFENAHDVIYTHDLAGNFTSFNKMAERLSGYSRGEALQMHVAKLLAPEHVDRARAMVDRKLAGEDSTIYQLEIISKSGERVPLEVATKLIYHQGKPVGVQGIGRDITERKRADEALRKTEELYRQAISAAGAVPYLREYATDTYTFMGQGIQQMTGYTPEEMTPKHWNQISLQVVMRGEAAGLTLEEAIQRTRAGEFQRWQSDGLFLAGDGVKRWIADTSVEVLGDSGKPIGSIGILQDITERKRMETRSVAFSALGQRLSTATTVEGAARVVVEVADELLGWDACSFDLYSPEEDVVFPILAIDIINGQRTEALNDLARAKPSAMMRRVLEKGGQLVLHEDPEAAPQDFVPFGDKSRRSASLLLVTIHQGERVLGMLSIQSYTRNAYTQDDLATLQALADHCSGAVERIQAEQKYRAIFENAVEGICRTTPNGRILAANPAAARMLGYDSPEELIASVTDLGLQLYLKPEHRAEIVRIVEELDILKGFELQLRRKDGGALWVSLNARAIRDASGAVLHYESTLEDISEHKRTGQELLRLATAVEQSTESIIITDLNGEIQYVNPACERIAGLPRHELIGQSFDLLLKGKDVPFSFTEIADKIGRTGVWTGRFSSPKKDNAQFAEESSISPIRSADGQIINYIAINRDVTRETALEEQVRLAQKMEAIGLLAGGVAHDFNNILQVIQGFTSLAKDEINAVEERNNYLDQVTQAAERASQLTRQLLAFGRRQPLQRTDTDLNQVVKNQLSMIQRLIGEHIEVHFVPAADLENVRADRSQLEQVLLNLCVNSRDAMPKGGRIDIRSENVLITDEFLEVHAWARRGRYVVLTVTDSGEGMDKEVVTRIFEPFFTTKAKDKGTGLGLAMVYGIVKQHEGMVHVESEPGTGTTFRIYLPVAERGARGEGQKTVGIPAKGTETVLLAEDEPQVRALAIRTLERVGYRVIAAADGEEAVRLFNENAQAIDLLIFDVVMPKMGGREAHDRIKFLKPGIPVLFCSGYSGTALTAGFELAPDVYLLQKPYTADSLLSEIRELLGVAK